MLREWVNSVIVKYNEIDRKNGNRNNGWIDFGILTITVFMTLHDGFITRHAKNNLLEEIESILSGFVEGGGEPDSNAVRIVSFWKPEYDKEISSIYLKILCIYPERGHDESEWIRFFKLLIYYPFLGKLYQLKKNNNIDYTKKAQEILDAFFDFNDDPIEELDPNQTLSEMQRFMGRYALFSEGLCDEGKNVIGKYCHMGKIGEELIKYDRRKMQPATVHTGI